MTTHHMQTGLRAGLKNWSALLLFEITYKVLGFGLISNLWGSLKLAVLRLLGVPFIGQQNLGLIFQNPIAVLLLLCVFLLLAAYVYLEIAALILYCEAGWRRARISAWALWKNAFRRSLSVFHFQNLPVVLALIPVIGLSAFPLTNGFMGRLRIPGFILEFIEASPGLFAAFILSAVFLHVLLFFYLFSFPDVILRGTRYRGSLRASARLLKGRKLKTAGVLLACVAAFLLFAAVFFALMILLLWTVGKFPSAADGGQAFFRFYYPRWSSMGVIFLSALAPVFFYSAVLTLYHRYRGDRPPEAAAAKRTPGSKLAQAAAVLAAWVVLALFSETELGGDPYPAYHPGTAVVAHRAGAAIAPENTLAALEDAIQSGADLAEIDVQLTRDGVPIVLHDADLRRTTGYRQKVWDTDFATVRSLDAGSSYSPSFAGEGIPTLAGMLAAAKGRIGLMIELKATGHEQTLVEQTVGQIRAAGMERDCMIASMDLALLRRSKALDPAIETVYITSLALSDRFDLEGVDGYSVEISFLSQEMVAQIQAQHRKSYAWTVNSDANFRKIIRLGADGVITDNPQLAVFYLTVFDRDFFLDSLTKLLYP